MMLSRIDVSREKKRLTKKKIKLTPSWHTDILLTQDDFLTWLPHFVSVLACLWNFYVLMN